MSYDIVFRESLLSGPSTSKSDQRAHIGFLSHDDTTIHTMVLDGRMSTIKVEFLIKH